MSIEFNITYYTDECKSLKGSDSLFMNNHIIYEGVEDLKRYVFIQRWIDVMKKNFMMTLGTRYDEEKVNRVIDKALHHIYLPRMRLVNKVLFWISTNSSLRKNLSLQAMVFYLHSMEPSQILS